VALYLDGNKCRFTREATGFRRES